MLVIKLKQVLISFVKSKNTFQYLIKKRNLYGTNYVVACLGFIILCWWWTWQIESVYVLKNARMLAIVC